MRNRTSRHEALTTLSSNSPRSVTVYWHGSTTARIGIVPDAAEGGEDDEEEEEDEKNDCFRAIRLYTFKKKDDSMFTFFLLTITITTKSGNPHIINYRHCRIAVGLSFNLRV